MRTALLALIVGLLATGCVVTTGGKPARSNTVHHHHRSKAKRNQNTAPAPTPAPAANNEAVAAPPIATPTPAAATPSNPTTRMPAIPGVMQPNRVPATVSEEEKEEEKKKTRAPQPTTRTPQLPTRAPQ